MDKYFRDLRYAVRMLIKNSAFTLVAANIYVVLTMRSDFLGDCAQFWDLPETVNESQYLTRD